jgi:hypothetical protein
MRRAILGFTFAFILCAAPLPCAQEHAPTVDVCRADRAFWHNAEEETDYLNQETKHINDGTRNRNPIAKLSFKEINLRMSEMSACVSVDEPNLDKYFDMMQFYSGMLEDRYRNFILRHHLIEQFKAEDAAGVR